MSEFLFKLSCRVEACKFSTKETWAQVFSCEFYEIFKNIYFTQHLQATVSETSPTYGYATGALIFYHTLIYLSD